MQRAIAEIMAGTSKQVSPVLREKRKRMPSKNQASPYTNPDRRKKQKGKCVLTSEEREVLHGVKKYINQKTPKPVWKSKFGPTQKPEWFKDLLKRGSWLDNDHLDEFLAHLRERQRGSPELIDQQAYIGDANLGWFLKEQKLKEEAAILDAFNKPEESAIILEEGRRLSETLMFYALGTLPANYATPWENIDSVYFPFNMVSGVNGKSIHWVTIRIDMKERAMKIYDSRVDLFTDEEFKKQVGFLEHMIPRLVALSFTGRYDNLPPKTNWPIERVKGVHQNGKKSGIDGDCGVYAMKYIENSVYRKDFNDIKDENMEEMRKQMAVDFFCKGQLLN